MYSVQELDAEFTGPLHKNKSAAWLTGYIAHSRNRFIITDPNGCKFILRQKRK